MFDTATIIKLREMKLKVMAQLLSEPDPGTRDMSFEDRFGLMVEKEWLQKKNSKITRTLHAAAFSVDACLEDIDYNVERELDKRTINTLGSCNFIEQKLNIVISGKTGTGKSYIACAFGNSACRRGYSVKYYRIPELLLEIQDAKLENNYSKFMASLQKIRLLILDDIGLKSYTLEESRDILEIFESRYNKRSTILSGQIQHTKWYDLFPDPTIADAIMDRIIHNSYIMALDSKKSMRGVFAEKLLKDIEKNELTE